MKLDQMASHIMEHHKSTAVQSEEVSQEGHEVNAQVSHLHKQITKPSISRMSESGRRDPFDP